MCFSTLKTNKFSILNQKKLAVCWQFLWLNYFPSYEIMMDELRDYRFYAEDMLHPNQTAINYIWERFSEAYFSKNTQTTMNEIEGIQKSISHKPFHSDSESHRQFLVKLQIKIASVQKQFSTIQF